MSDVTNSDFIASVNRPRVFCVAQYAKKRRYMGSKLSELILRMPTSIFNAFQTRDSSVHRKFSIQSDGTIK